jgi:hypothetical protein
MREKHVADPQLMLSGERQILTDVALRIDHRRDARVLVADQVRRVCEAIEVELLEDHGVNHPEFAASFAGL